MCIKSVSAAQDAGMLHYCELLDKNKVALRGKEQSLWAVFPHAPCMLTAAACALVSGVQL
jgi:hypothetical protein